MKKSLQRLFFLLFFVMAAPVAWAQSGYVVKSGNGVNMRSGAGTDFGVVATVPAGSRVKVVEQGSNGWNKVEYQGKTGYVSALLLEKENGQQRNNGSSGSSSASRDRQSESSGNGRNSAGKGRNSSGNNGASAHTWGLGLRAGDPAGITLKKYRGNGSALEFVVGRSFRWGYKYDDRFYRYSRFTDRDAYAYKGYTRDFTTSFQIHYLLHKSINGAPGLQFYYGAGGQARFTPVEYAYAYKRYYGSDKKQYEWVYARERVNDLDLGLDGVLGLEYTFREIPFSIFADVNAFVEIFDAPLWISGQSGIGLRFNF
jgi:hypothetical protein